MTRLFTLTEDIPSEPVHLHPGERDALGRLVPQLLISPARGAHDTYHLTGGSTVGVVRVGELTVELRPRVGMGPALFLLSYSVDPSGWREETAALAPDANLAESLVPLFVRLTERTLRPGLLHGYRRYDDTLATIRGRVRMADQFRVRPGLPLPVEVTYDDYTPDILENRLLRTAVDDLGRLRLRQADSRTSLARLHRQLHGISALGGHGRRAAEPPWTRLNDRYRPAVRLARLILLGSGLDVRAAAYETSAFLVDMNEVFSRFLRAALREELGLNAVTFPDILPRPGLTLDLERRIPVEPDLTWWTGQRCVFVGDCTYRRLPESAPHTDLYRMLAHLTALELREGLLVYAAGEDVPPGATVRHSRQRVHVRTVDVTQPPYEVLEQVGEVAAQVREMRR